MTKITPPQTPQTAPTLSELSRAGQVLNEWHLHYYQLLFFKNLTKPGKGDGRPFEVVRALGDYHPTLTITCAAYPEYNFKLRGVPSEEQAAYDESVLEKCGIILAAISAGKTKVNRLACCPLAVAAHCICNFKGDCPVHGGQCNGSHD